jgi:hypothetical protein
MRDDRLEVSVSFDEQRGYVGTAPELRAAVVALSLGGLRRRIDALMVPDAVDVRLILDRSVRRERDRRRSPCLTPAERLAATLNMHNSDRVLA